MVWRHLHHGAAEATMLHTTRCHATGMAGAVAVQKAQNFWPWAPVYDLGRRYVYVLGMSTIVCVPVTLTSYPIPTGSEVHDFPPLSLLLDLDVANSGN